MSFETLKDRRTLALLSLSLLLTALLAVPLAFSQAQTKKETIHDTFTRESNNSVRLKTGFEVVKKSNNRVTVRRIGATTVLGELGCGSCPGGACQFNGCVGGGCRMVCGGCGKADNNACTLNPFEPQ